MKNARCIEAKLLLLNENAFTVKSTLYKFSLIILPALFLFYQCTDEKITLEATGTIQGRVVNETDLSSVANAEISTSPATHIVLTDSAGRFTMEDVELGEYSVIAKHKDYFSASTSIKVKVNTTTNVILNLNQRITDDELPWLSDNYYPQDQQEDVPVNVTLQWQLKARADSADFELRLFESGQPVEVHMEALTDTFAVVSGLKFNTTYLWQLSAENEAGEIYSDVRSFTTQQFPEHYLLYAKRVDDIAQVFVADSTADISLQITHNNYHSWKPVMNSRKTRIAFLSTRDISPQLFTMNLDGSDVKKLSSIPTGGYYNKQVGFGWLPNGEKLVFSSFNRLYVVNHDGTGLTQVAEIPSERHFREVDWSQTNDKIVALTLGADRYDAEIVMMDTDGSNLEVIVGGLDGALQSPVFSVAANKILYTYDVSGFQSAEGRQLDARIFEYNIATGETRDLSAQKPNGTNDLYPRYTENGAEVIFVNTYNTPDSQRDLWIMRADSTQSNYRRKLIDDVEMPGWE